MPRPSRLSRPEIPDKFFNSGLSVINNVFKFFNLDKSDIVEILVFLTVSFSRLLNPEIDKREVILEPVSIFVLKLPLISFAILHESGAIEIKPSRAKSLNSFVLSFPKNLLFVTILLFKNLTPENDKVTSLENQLITMSNNICTKYNISSEEDEMIAAMDGIVKSEVEKSNEDDVDSLWTPVGLPKQSKVVCVGRICNEVRYIYFVFI